MVRLLEYGLGRRGGGRVCLFGWGLRGLRTEKFRISMLFVMLLVESGYTLKPSSSKCSAKEGA